MANRFWFNRIRGILLPASFVNLFFTITSDRYSFHCIRRNLLYLLRGSHGAFLSDLVRARHDNAFLCPSPQHCYTCLSHIVSDSDMARFRFGVLFKIVSDFSWVSFLWRASWIDPSVVRSCHTPDLLSSAYLTYCTVARGRPRLCSRSDLLQDLGGLL